MTPEAKAIAAKLCGKCGVEFVRTESQVRHGKTTCNDCDRAYHAARREARKLAGLSVSGTRPTNAYKRAYEADYRKRPDVRAKIKARSKVLSALRVGRLQKLNCQVCDAPNAEAHHDDYSRPLDVIWLCKLHHQERHQMLLDQVSNPAILKEQPHV